MKFLPVDEQDVINGWKRMKTQRDENVRDIFVAFIPTMRPQANVDVIVQRD